MILWSTLFKKRLAEQKYRAAGMVAFQGPQGAGKTLSMVTWLEHFVKKNPEETVIYSNIRLNNFPDRAKIFYYDSSNVSDVLRTQKDEEGRQMVIVVDEIGQLFLNNKRSAVSAADFSAVTQMRKRSILVLSTIQNFADLATHIRRHFKLLVTCKAVFRRFQVNLWQDAQEASFDVEKDRYAGSVVDVDIFKRCQYQGERYDTFELISEFAKVQTDATTFSQATPVVVTGARKE